MSLLERFEKEVGEVIESHRELLADGRSEDIEQYRRTAGIIYGLKQAMAILHEIVKKSGEDEEE